MSFLMYAPKGRRDYLSADLSIEDEFLSEAEKIEGLEKKTSTVDIRQNSILGDADKRT